MGKLLNKHRRHHWVITGIILAAIAALWLLRPGGATAAGAAVCAEVKIEIKQELTLERQAFDAHMRINNGLSHISLEDVDVDVSFSDEAGEPVVASSDPDHPSAQFFIRLDSMENISNVDGFGSVGPATSADIHWLIIPAAGASNGLAQGTLYYVGATLTYTVGGEENVTEVTPDYIFVKPMPEMTLDYFLTREVYGDDAFTPEIEPSVPFTLGVRIKNSGNGVARNLKIESAQPKIVENELGLLIGFAIESSFIGNQPIEETLLVDFGDIDAGQSKIGRWMMTCSLSGEFTAFEAGFTHSDELGGQLTSLITDAETHFLIRDVKVDLAGRDDVADFLAQDGDIIRVYESEGIDTEVNNQSAAVLTAAGQSGSRSHYTLSVPGSAGFIYVRLPDPHGGQKILAEAVRSDGKLIKPDNAWLSKSRQPDQSWNYYVNLFDADTTDAYTITFDSPESLPEAPVLQFIADKAVAEGQSVGFIITASDPDGTIPVLSGSPLPAGAELTDEGNGMAAFAWTPAVGQAGGYEVTFKASDGVLSDTQRVKLTVFSVDDSDGDGMLDTWETDRFGDLSRDGSGDFDGDGISDLDEFLFGTDPTSPDHAPTAPLILTPVDGDDVHTLAPDLVIENSTDADGDAISYEFEVFADDGLTELTTLATFVAEGLDQTAWTVDTSLADNHEYTWRVRATDGIAYSNWTYGRFFVNTENDPPDVPRIAGPRDNSDVAGILPTLSVINTVDPDRDEITYRFEIYADEAMTVSVASSGDMAAGPDGTTDWASDVPLDDSGIYYWRVAAVDGNGGQNESLLSAFTVNTANTPPTEPQIALPADGTEIDVYDPELTIANSSDAEGHPVVYYFELDTSATFDSPDLQVSPQVSQDIDTTAWPTANLNDDTGYLWRALASDGSADSRWAVARFFVNRANDNPAAPLLKNPSHQAWVGDATPVLEVAAPVDPDQDALDYRFEVYADDLLTHLVAEGSASEPTWEVPVTLTNGQWYYWRVQAVDEHGLTGFWMTAGAMLIRDDGVDTPPAITISEPAQDLLTNADVLTIAWHDSDPDSNAQISLFYDTDTDGIGGIEIAGGLSEDPDDAADTYDWDIAAVADGTYHLYAVISDQTGSVTAVSTAAVTIDHTPPVPAASPAGGTYVAAQSVNLSADEAAEIYYTTDGSEPTVESTLYDSPIDIDADATLKFVAVDAAGNQSAVVTETYLIQTAAGLDVTAKTDKHRLLAGIKVYAFTAAGAYTGHSKTTDSAGIAHFDPADLADGSYKFRVDYLGRQFWSDPATVPDVSALDVVIAEETAVVTITTAAGPQAGVKVYLFSESGAYLGSSAITDAAGVVSFDLPVGFAFSFRADILGSQYWSAEAVISGGEVNDIALDAGGGRLQVTLAKGPGDPMADIKIYLFNAVGAYLGRNQTTDDLGQAAFDVSQGTYTVRADYLGDQFWSDPITVDLDTHLDLTIAHHDVPVTVSAAFQGTTDPLENVDVFLFGPSGSYLGRKLTTDIDGRAVFNLPQKEYQFRADYLGEQYWSGTSVWQDVDVDIAMADVQITVTGGGFPLAGVNVYVFSAADAYLNLNATTDTDGRVVFRLPENDYKFRVDYQGGQYWSDLKLLTADLLNPVAVSVGGGSFALTVTKNGTDPMGGLPCYVYDENDAYLGLLGATDDQGQAVFDLADGTFKFRVDYLGDQFFSDVVGVPAQMTVTLDIAHETVAVNVLRASQPAAGVRVYLFDDGDNYLGFYQETDAAGQVFFDLPVGRAYKFRADILNRSYWSEAITVADPGPNDVALDAGGGRLQATVQKAAGSPMAGIKTYLYDENDVYLGKSANTAADGTAVFEVPGGSYRLRADYMGYSFWTAPAAVSADTDIVVDISHQPVDVTVEADFQGALDPIAAAQVYLFSPTDAYQGFSRLTDADGSATFDLPEKAYKARVDFLGSQYWSDPLIWQPVTVAVPMAEAELTVTGAGFPEAGVWVYVFTPAGQYLGLSADTDAAGKAIFRLPAGDYQFRVDYQGSGFFSAVETLAADQVNPVIVSVGGGSFTLSVLKNGHDPMAGLKCYVFDDAGAYLGLSGATDDQGQVSFDLADGGYKFRIDYLGNQFWTDPVTVPASLADTLSLDHIDATVAVSGDYPSPEALADVKVYLFSPAGAYLGVNRTTDANGQAVFSLPDEEFKVRADYLGYQFWSQVFRFTDAAVIIDRGRADIQVTRAGQNVAEARVYLFSAAGAYLGRYKDTGIEGKAEFFLPAKAYQFRVDEGPDQVWSPVVDMAAGQVNTVPVSLD